MVLGFGSKKKKSSTDSTVIRASPSLPELASQQIPWPENLVDVDSVHASSYPAAVSDGHGPPHGASKTSFHASRAPAIPFHKPFRTGDASTPGSPVSPHPSNSIASLYGSGAPPSAFNGVGPRTRAGSNPYSRSGSTRRTKHPPTFNVMVAGAKHTGKSSLLRLLLDTSTISPASSPDQLLSLSTFRSSSVRPTSAINTACVEILQVPTNRAPGPEDRITLTCIDTPGLDFSEGKEFALDRAVSGVVKYVDLQFAETMGEESKVVRTSKGDQHVHLCIYLIDPDSVMTPSARRARSRLAASAFPAQPLAPSDLPEPSEYDSGSDDDVEVDTSHVNGNHEDNSDDEYGTPEPSLAPERTPLTPISPSDQTPRNSLDPGADPKTAKVQQLQSPPQSLPKSQVPPQKQNRLAMNPAEIRVITRLAKRVNVLPVVARADTLTDGRLERIKRAVRRDLEAVRFEEDEEGGATAAAGVFAVWDADADALFGRRRSRKENTNLNDSVPEDPEFEEERQSRPVIKLRERGSNRGLTRSRSRKSLKTAVGAEYDDPDPGTQPAYPVSPPPSSPGHGQESISRRASANGAIPGVTSSGPAFSRAELRERMPFAIIAPERERDRDVKRAGGSQNGHASGALAPELTSKFVRRFRWGTVNVLDPEHCDFAALRVAVLGSYMRALKATTKDVLYERFRTEKLLARRATRNISDEDRKRILQDLGL